jgi:uncharacterized protein DUF4242
VLYTAKCYWPGVTEDEVRLASTHARHDSAERRDTAYRGTLYLPVDEVALCLFEASSREAVKQSSERSGMPCERVIETVWIAAHAQRGGSGCGL